MPQKNIIQYTVILLGIVIIAVIGAVALVNKNQNANSANNTRVVTNAVNVSNTNTAQVVLSEKRPGVTNTAVYETKTNGERCTVIDLNNYIPTRNEAAKTYEWIIEFPPDNCVIQKPATNLPETSGETKSDTILGTNYRRITVTFQ